MTEFAPRMRRILGVYQSRARDPDIEQAWLRIGICTLAFGYVWYLILVEGQVSVGLWMGLIASVGDMAIAGLMIWRLRRGDANVVRLRYLGIIADNTALTIGMAGAGEGGVAMIGVYLWVTIGNGFRFGPRFLLASYWLSIIGFGLQLALVPFWELHRVVGAGLFLAGAIVPLYVLVLLIRLTGQKEAAEQLSNAKSRFVANVSHELRTPLTGIFAVYDLLRNRATNSGDQELIGVLGNAIRTLKSSVDAVLQMSKLEAGAERAEHRPFNLWLFLHQLSATVIPQSTAKGLQWTLRIEPNVSPNVRGDPEHLSHVLGNLINNAFKFTQQGAVSLRVRTNGDLIRFEVQDSGIGIPLDQQERLFERFVQVDGSAKRKFGGTGLGTSIARDLTELMGGKIGVTSAPGAGSKFHVDLPLTRDAPSPDPIDSAGNRKVLVIGDDSLARSVLVERVRSVGYDVELRERRVAIDVSTTQQYLAAFLVMGASSAIPYCASALRDRFDSTCPWAVVSPTMSSEQESTLVSYGASALLNEDSSLDDVRHYLTHIAFRLEVPIAHQAAPSVTQKNRTVRSLSLLVADDNASIRMLISRILSDAGHSVKEAERGDQAFDMLASGTFDLALLDLNMPDMSGPDVIKLFRAGSVGAEHLPIVILSADATPAAKQDSLDAGADEFLTKPVTSDALLSAIDRLALKSVALATTPGPEVNSPRTAAFANQLVDQDQIQSLRRVSRGDARFLDQYVSAAFADLEKAVSDLRIATASNNVRDARLALHIIEGTGGSLGAAALVQNCKSMRAYTAVPGDPDCGAALAELSTTLALTKSAVVAALHDLPRRPDVRIGSSHQR